MTDHPYTPHPETARALQRGATQIRIPLEPQPPEGVNLWSDKSTIWAWRQRGKISRNYRRLPYAKGDTLWLREAWQKAWISLSGIGGGGVRYKLDGTHRGIVHRECNWQWNDREWRPADTMPRWASRLRYRVISVRVEPVQKISEEDAVASAPLATGVLLDPYWGFRDHWNAIYGPGAWDRNPWVAVYDLEKL